MNAATKVYTIFDLWDKILSTSKKLHAISKIQKWLKEFVPVELQDVSIPPGLHIRIVYGLPGFTRPVEFFPHKNNRLDPVRINIVFGLNRTYCIRSSYLKLQRNYLNLMP